MMNEKSRRIILWDLFGDMLSFLEGYPAISSVDALLHRVRLCSS